MKTCSTTWPGYLVEHQYDLKSLIEHIVTSQICQARPVPLTSERVGDDYVFRGPEVKRMTAEQYLDACVGDHRGRADQARCAGQGACGPGGRRLEARLKVRASMVNSNLLMRSLGRPNREQVVTTRGDVLTTLQALDLSNGQILTDLVATGAANTLKARPAGDPRSTGRIDLCPGPFRRPGTAELATGP